MPIRVCFIGDSFVNGIGDVSGLGWVGRVCAASRQRGIDLTCYNLGIRRDTSADILVRWKREAACRLLPEHDGRLIFSFGANDCCLTDDGSRVRVPHAEALTNARAILTDAQSWLPTLMVGPIHVGDADVDARIAALSADFASLCAALKVPYFAMFQLVAASGIWAREVAAGDGAHPNAGGYSIVADAVERWRAWQA